MHRTGWLRVLLVTVLGACAGSQPPAAPPPKPEAKPETLKAPESAPRITAVPASQSRAESDVLARFQAEVAKKPDLTHADFARELGLTAAADAPLSFDPTKLRYFDRIAEDLALTAEEKALFKKNGVVAIDHDRPYSIGSAYHAIYARDLPVLITTDSILHALHRSFDNVLSELESTAMLPALDDALGGAHEELGKRARELGAPGIADSAGDVDVYLTVARSLLGGKPVPSKLGKDAEVGALLAKIDALAPPSAYGMTPLYGGARVIDFSQFRPRGHYTKSEALQRYFRLMMWLGRPDTGFVLAPPDPQSGLDVHAAREARSAALLTFTLAASGKLARIRDASALIDFLVGASDNATLDEAALALEGAGLTAPPAFADEAKIRAFTEKLGQAAAQTIRSQFLTASTSGSAKVEAPKAFQVFGQRFAIDSFVLSQVVFDSIVFKGKKPLRMMPSGLDVMAALGSDEAARLLQPEIEKYNYGSNLLAARRTVEARSAAAWEADVYDMWLDSLRALERPPSGKYAPAVMTREPWRRKTLETQLSSWSQLRHDTILYVKQSYTAFPLCGYPAGFVEPYPDFYARLAKLARRAAERLSTMNVGAQVGFFNGFANVMDTLGRLATKELAGQPFSQADELFLKVTVDASAVGSGGVRYDGWYPKIIYGEEAGKWHPTVADVHTDPESGQALEVGVGNATFLVVAIDNGADRAAYVGPISSFYSFTEPASQRLTDETWQQRVGRGGAPPPRPAFTSAYRAPPKGRDLGPVINLGKVDRKDPRVQRLEKLFNDLQNESDLGPRRRIIEQMNALRREILKPPPP